MKKHLIISIVLEIILCWGSPENAFSQTHAGRDTTICKGNKVIIGSPFNSSIWCYTWSPDNGTLNDKKSPEPEASPTSTTLYSVTVVGPDFSFTHKDDMTLKIIDPKVKFQEYLTQKYGFDNYTDSITPWKSVKKGDNDKIIAKITPAPDYNHIFFKSSDPAGISLLPKKASSEVQELTITGVIKGSAEIQANGDKEDGINIKKINIRALSELAKTVAIMRIAEENDDLQIIDTLQGLAYQISIEPGPNGILDSNRGGDDELSGNAVTTGSNGICETKALSDDIQIIKENNGHPNEVCVSDGPNQFRDTKRAKGDDVIIGNDISTGPDGICNTPANNTNVISTDIADYNNVEVNLKQIYGQAVIVWTIIKLPVCIVNYDLDRNDSIDVRTPFMSSTEMIKIRDKCGNLSYFRNIFLVDKPSDGSLGFMGFNQPYGYIHGDVKSAFIGNTISHELGHSLGLPHTYEVVNEASTTEYVKDVKNLMHPTTNVGWRLRVDQWNIINP